MEFNTTKELIEDIAEGKMVILLDDEDHLTATQIADPAQVRANVG